MMLYIETPTIPLEQALGDREEKTLALMENLSAIIKTNVNTSGDTLQIQSHSQLV